MDSCASCGHSFEKHKVVAIKPKPPFPCFAFDLVCATRACGCKQYQIRRRIDAARASQGDGEGSK